MQTGMIPARLTPHNRPYFLPASKILILPSKSGKTRSRLARRLIGRHVCQLGGGGGGGLAESILSFFSLYFGILRSPTTLMYFCCTTLHSILLPSLPPFHMNCDFFGIRRRFMVEWSWFFLWSDRIICLILRAVLMCNLIRIRSNTSKI